MFLRNQTRPIVKLSKAAERFGRGERVDDLRPSGASEIRKATLEFDKMMKRINKHLAQRSEMLSGISHDLRTPLTRLKLQLAMMDKKETAQKMAEAQADIAQQQREALSSEAELRDQKRDDMRAEIESAREAQSGSESEEEDAGFVSVAERFAEYNARLRQINETLLRISSPSLPTSGTLFDEEA